MTSICDLFNYDDQCFGWTFQFYKLLNLIYSHQTSYCLVTTRRINKEKARINREISALKSLNSLSRQQRRMLAVLQNNVNGMFQDDIWNRAFNLNINYETLGEQATGWLLRRHLSKRGCAFI